MESVTREFCLLVELSIRNAASCFSPDQNTIIKYNNVFDHSPVAASSDSSPKTRFQACFTRGENGKLGAGGGECDRRGEEKSPGAEPGTTGSKVLNNWVDHGSLPWLLSLAKTTTLLAGRYAATLTVGNCGISPFLESYFRSPTYRQWLKSDLLSGGCDPSYEALMLTPIDANSGEDASSCLENNIRAAVPETNACSTSHFQWVRNAMPSRREVADFLEEVAGGYGRGGRFSVWLGETLAPSDAAYRIIKRQATTGRNGGLLRNAERVMLAAMLKHADLDRDAVLFSSALVKRRESGGDETPNGTTIRPPPRKFALLWKSMAEVKMWFVRSYCTIRELSRRHCCCRIRQSYSNFHRDENPATLAFVDANIPYISRAFHISAEFCSYVEHKHTPVARVTSPFCFALT